MVSGLGTEWNQYGAGAAGGGPRQAASSDH